VIKGAASIAPSWLSRARSNGLRQGKMFGGETLPLAPMS
jgi:hypothetical protein